MQRRASIWTGSSKLSLHFNCLLMKSLSNFEMQQEVPIGCMKNSLPETQPLEGS